MSIYYSISALCFYITAVPLKLPSFALNPTASGLTRIKPIRDMNWQPPPVTRCKYVHVRSDAAPTTMEGGSAGFAGAKTCHAAYGQVVAANPCLS